MGGARVDGESPSTRRDSARRLKFDPDPSHLLTPLPRAVEVAKPGPAPQAEPTPSQVFRILRPDDLAVFEVRGYDLELQSGEHGPALVPTTADARIEVCFTFQHLGERAYYTTGDPPPAPGVEPPEVPPIPALAAQPSRLSFDVPEGERIDYDIAGVLAAISRLPLRVVPLATPRATALRPGLLKPGELTQLVTLPGGFLLGRATDGSLAVAAAPAPKRSRSAANASRAIAGARSVIANATALRSARALLAEETAVDVSRKAADPKPPIVRRGIGERIDPIIVRPVPLPARQRPRAPRTDETAIEAPFRLIISPSVQGGFTHTLEPASAPGDDARVELWHTRLGVRKVDDDDGTVTIDEARHPQRIIRAVWARDKVSLPPDADAPQGNTPFRMSLTPRDRVVLVRQSSDPLLATPTPVDVDRLYLSSLGAFLDLHGRWPDTEPYSSKGFQPISLWDHEAPMGRDQYVRVAYPGYLFPFGHRCALIKVTERKILDATNPQATLFQRKFIVLSQPLRTYDDRRLPFRQVSIRPLVTPDIRDPLDPGTPNVLVGELLFWPVVGNGKFRFTLDCFDHGGKRRRFQAPLLFVSEMLPQDKPGQRASDIRNAYVSDPESPIPGDAQSIAYALGTIPGDTDFESLTLRFDGIPGPAGSATSTPFLTEADIIVPAMRHLAPSAPKTTVKYAQPYLDEAFGGKNTDAQVFFELKNAATISFGGGTDRSGGFVQPDLPVRGLSRVLGAVGDIDDLVNAPAAQKFNPQKFLAGVLPKLFGLFELTDILSVVGLDKAPKFITEQLDRIGALLADLDTLKEVITRSAARLAEDAAGAATSKLKQQAQAAQTAIDGIRAQLEPQVNQLVAAIEALMDLGTPSSVPDVTAAVSGFLNAIAAQVTALRNVVRNQPLPPPVKAEIERLINALEPVLDAGAVVDTINAIAQFVNGLDPEGMGLRAKFDWRPTLTNFPNVADDDALFIVRPDGFLLSVEARASGKDGVGVDVLAELREFALNLFPTAPLMRLGFDRLAFRAASGRKPEVDVVFRGIEFVGVLSFIETLKNLIPFDAFSDPPYVDVSTEGVTAGFSIALPSTAVGVFSLENISLGADARVPFIGNEALTIGFNFCTREKPFRLTVMMIGGGGFVGIRLSPRGLVLLEMALEAGASLSINLGVASGSVSIMVGVYLRLEADAGSLTGYFRIRGEVDVLGLISASITLELSLTYEFATGKLVGRASIEIEVEVFMFSFSVTVSCERRLAGSNGDPTFEQVIGVLPDGSSPAWSQYCAAFAEE